MALWQAHLQNSWLVERIGALVTSSELRLMSCFPCCEAQQIDVCLPKSSQGWDGWARGHLEIPSRRGIYPLTLAASVTHFIGAIWKTCLRTPLNDWCTWRENSTQPRSTSHEFHKLPYRMGHQETIFQTWPNHTKPIFCIISCDIVSGGTSHLRDTGHWHPTIATCLWFPKHSEPLLAGSVPIMIGYIIAIITMLTAICFTPAAPPSTWNWP